MIEINDFLEFPDALIGYSKEAAFKDEVNPVDGVVYPLICADIPEPILHDIMFNLTYKVLSRLPKDPTCFMRRSPAGVDVPHKFHTDNSMGDYSLMLYLEDREDAGTGFAKHIETGATDSNIDDDSLSKTIRDCNTDSKWQIYKEVEMVKNKALIFDASMFHVALPIGGFGEANKARTVLTCFFS